MNSEPTEIKEEKIVEEVDPKTLKYNIVLTKIDASNKLKIIKEIKTLFNIGLSDAKNKVEKLPAPLATNLGFDEKEIMKVKLEGLGCELIIEN